MFRIFIGGVVLLVSYFLGCINGSVMTSHFVIKDDVRKHGSGNAGLTNFYRTYGAKYALLVIALDMGKTVVAGLIGGFMFSHLFFVLLYRQQILSQRLNFLLILPLAAAYYGFSLFIIRRIRDNTPKAMVVPMYFYLLCNSTMNIFAMMQLLSRPSLAAAAAYVGALLFYASDCCLFLVRYGRKPEIIFKKHFTVMLTYLLGELLIVVGILML